MKVVLFQRGNPGREYVMAGDQPVADLEELLEGEVEFTPLNRRLSLVSRKDGEALRLPIHYSLHQLGRCVEPVAGDCAVVVRGGGGVLGDVNAQDVAAAVTYVRPVGWEA